MHPELRLTYAQIGAKLGITPDAARMLARRRGWPRQAPNHRGSPVFVIVPETALEGEQWRTENERTSPNEGANTADADVNGADERTEHAERRAEQAEHRADEANKRADVALALADRLTTQLADATARIDQAEEARRQAEVRADALHERLGHVQHDLAAAEASAKETGIQAIEARAEAKEAKEVAEALQQTEEARKRRGRLARLRAAWRGE